MNAPVIDIEHYQRRIAELDFQCAVLSARVKALLAEKDSAEVPDRALPEGVLFGREKAA